MNCPEARELLSALLDEALDARERGEVQAHLDSCPDCRRELDGLRSTVALLSRVEHPRAPVGFVDRILAEARPVPWYRRVGRLIFVPLSIKLPIEAGAMVVIALLGVYLLQSTPELKDAARLEPPSASSRADVPPAAPPVPAPAPAVPAVPSRERDARAGTTEPEKATPAPPSQDRLAPAERRKEAKKDGLQQAAPSAAPPATERESANLARPSQDRLSETREEAKKEGRSALSKTMDSREGSADRADADRKGALGAAPAAPSILSAKQQVAPPMVSGVLTVKDRQQAERALADLISRANARETGRRQDGSATIVDLLVPQAGYAAFVQELASLGSVKVEGQPADVPPLVRLSIRITE